MNSMRCGWIAEPLYTKIRNNMPIPCVDILVLHENRLLLMKRRNTPGKGLWFTPGGRILKGESLEGAVNRVLSEETGLSAIQITQCGAMSHDWPEIQTITVFYKVIVDSDSVLLNEEHSEFMWISEPLKDLHPYVIYMAEKSNIFINSK